MQKKTNFSPCCQDKSKNSFLKQMQTSWWFQHIWKILVKLDHFQNRGENKNIWNHHLANILNNSKEQRFYRIFLEVHCAKSVEKPFRTKWIWNVNLLKFTLDGTMFFCRPVALHTSSKSLPYVHDPPVVAMQGAWIVEFSCSLWRNGWTQKMIEMGPIKELSDSNIKYIIRSS